jgi:cell division cycle 20, cofactor of APC complex
VFVKLILQTCTSIVDCPDISGDFYTNLIDWGSDNVLSIALQNTVYLWNASGFSASKLVTVDEEHGPVTSVSWSPDGCHLAIGLDDSLVQLWDTTAKREVNIVISF